MSLVPIILAGLVLSSWALVACLISSRLFGMLSRQEAQELEYQPMLAETRNRKGSNRDPLFCICQGNIIRYVYRSNLTHGKLQDLEKSRYSLDQMIHDVRKHGLPDSVADLLGDGACACVQDLSRKSPFTPCTGSGHCLSHGAPTMID